MNLLFVDSYHLGDPFFLSDLGRRLSTLGSSGRTIVFHDVAEAVNAALEHADQAEKYEAAERAVRESNQALTRVLIEAGAPAVSIQGCDRGLFRADDRDGIVTSKDSRWIVEMTRLGTIPVISPLAVAEQAGGTVPLDPVACVTAFTRSVREAGGISLQGILFCTNRKAGLYDDKGRLSTLQVAGLRAFSDLIDTSAAEQLVAAVDRLVATNSVSMAGEGDLPGTVLTR